MEGQLSGLSRDLIQYFPNIIRQLQTFHGTEQVHLASRQSSVRGEKTGGHIESFRLFMNSSLARKKIPEYYSCRCRNVGNDVHSFGLMFCIL
jgi:hypothetical protein